VPGRHIAPRHKAPRSASRLLGRLANNAVSAVPVVGAVAIVGAASVAAGLGVGTLDADAETTTQASERPSLSTPSPTDDDALTKRRGDSPSSRDNTDAVSRSSVRPALAVQRRETKHRAMSVSHQSVTGRVVESVAPTDPREIAALMLADYGWDSSQFSCLDSLYISESNWDHAATNPSSGAYGIPQSLPAEKMAVAGDDWRTNPATQIEWGFDYIASRYGSPCSAWSFKQGNNWY